MKHVSKLLWLSLCLFALWFAGCQKERSGTPENKNPLNSQELSGTPGNKISLNSQALPALAAVGSPGSLTENGVTLCAAEIFPLCTSGNATSPTIGNLMVQSGSDGKVYLTFTTTGSHSLKGIKLYAGGDANIPVNGGGNVKKDDFPFKDAIAAPGTQLYSVVLSGLTGTITLAAHVETASTEAWADGCTGTRINTGNGNWATKITYTIQPCPVILCSLSQGYWFANGGHSWPSGSVVVGGKTYTQAEGAAIWDAYPTGRILGFTQVAALKLSGTAYNSDAQLSQAVTTIETWLASMAKLTTTAVPEMPADVKTAAGFIGDWINTHHCDE